MISRNLNIALQVAHKLYTFSAAMLLNGVMGQAGYFIRTDEREEYFIGNVIEYPDGVVEAYSILFRTALNYPGSKVLLLVKGKLYSFDPILYKESEEPWLRIKICLSAGHQLK